MEQYEKSGASSPIKVDPVNKVEKSIDDLSRHIEAQDRRIDELERDFRSLRNDVRAAISAANTIAANRQRNG